MNLQVIGDAANDLRRRSPGGLEKKPRATFRFVDPDLDQACAGDIAPLVTKRVYPSRADRQLPIIFQEFREDVLGGDISLVVMGDGLKSGDVPNRMQGRSADLSHPLRDRIGRSENLLTLLVEKKMIVAEMRTRYMPVKILRLDVKGEHVGQDSRQGGRDIADDTGFKTWRSVGWSKRPTGRFSSIHRSNLL